MKNLCVFGLLLLFFQSCALSASQEASLNSAKTSFVKSKNEGLVLSYVAFTLPEVVAFYKNQSDSSFQKRFDLSSINAEVYLMDGNVKEVVSKGMNIHVKYDFQNSQSEENTREMIFALSNNDGKSWYFAEGEDYFNTNIIPEGKRLINRE
ncbi:MAG: hypothetical protein KC454_03260 [Flavobacteriales bacterium]|nr:hypothetical protein [Flavobacteriales bacterium]